MGQARGDAAMRERSSSPSSNEPEATSEAEAEYPQEDSPAAVALAAFTTACHVGAAQDTEAAEQAVAGTDVEGLAAADAAAAAEAADNDGPVPTPATTATNTEYGTDTDGPEEPPQQQQKQQQQQCASAADSGAAAERVTSMMARQVARLVSSALAYLHVMHWDCKLWANSCLRSAALCSSLLVTLYNNLGVHRGTGSAVLATQP
jgi:hypothetical protein